MESYLLIFLGRNVKCVGSWEVRNLGEGVRWMMVGLNLLSERLFMLSWKLVVLF